LLISRNFISVHLGSEGNPENESGTPPHKEPDTSTVGSEGVFHSYAWPYKKQTTISLVFDTTTKKCYLM